MKLNTLWKISWSERLSQPYFLGIPIALLFILLLPDTFKPFELTLVKSGLAHKASSIEYYHDLNSDGYSEHLVFFKNTLGIPALKVLSHEGNTIDQWNFSGRFPERQGFYSCGDLNNDSIQEIYLFTISSDSLFLHCIEPFSKESREFSDKFVSTIWKCNDTIQLFIGRKFFSDINADGTTDFLFNVKAGFSLQPRGIFVYDRKNDTILRSSPIGANLGETTVLNTDSDPQAEIYLSCNTLGNISDSVHIPYNDYSSYFMAYDHELKMMFPPIEYDVYPSFSSHCDLDIDGKKYFLVFFKNRSDKNIPSLLQIVDPEGMILHKVEIDSKEPWAKRVHHIQKLFSTDGKETPALVGSGFIVFINNDLEVTEVIESDVNHMILRYDLSNDGKDEMVFMANDNDFRIMQDGFKHPVLVKTFQNPFTGIHRCTSIRENGDQYPELFVKSENNAYWYTFKSNPYSILKYPIWLFIYLCVIFCLFMIRSIYKAQFERKIEMENHLNALQLKTLKSQMDPHFMFNALNSISMSILNKEPNVAYRYMVKYSQLQRMLLTKADQLAISLKEELSFIEQYLELEQFRYENKLSFSILMQPGVNEEVLVPRMLLQLHVENALKHGLAHKEDLGHISVKGENKGGSILLQIEDNGIGRQAAKKVSEGSGKGLKIIDEMISLFSKIKGINITYEYSDLKDDTGKASGTRVSIILPNRT